MHDPCSPFVVFVNGLNRLTTFVIVVLWAWFIPGCDTKQVRDQTHSVMQSAPQPARQIDLGSGVMSASFHPGSNQLAAGLANGKIAIMTSDDWENVSYIGSEESGVSAVSFSPDGRWLASSSDALTIKIWDTKSFHCVVEINDPSGATLGNVAFSPKGGTLCCSAHRHIVRLYSTETWEVIAEYDAADSKILEPDPVPMLWGLDYSQDGMMIVIGMRPGSVLLDAETLTELRCWPTPDSAVNQFAFSPDGTRVAGTGASVHLWDLKDNSDRLLSFYQQFRGSPSSLCFSADGKFLAVGLAEGAGLGNTVVVYSIAESKFIVSFPCHRALLRRIAFCPKTNRLVTASVDHTLCEWDWEKMIK